MKDLLALCVAIVLALAASIASAAFHLFTVEQVYSNADGTVQFIVLRNNTSTNNEQFIGNHDLISTGPGPTQTFTFPSNLPSSLTAFKRVLIATPGFAALGLVTPDYIIPSGFVQRPSGAINFADVSVLAYSNLPTNGVQAVDPFGAPIQNVATNFAGASASVPGAVPPTVDLNQHGLTGSWFEPATSGQGFAVEVFPDQSPGQGQAFVSWFTYDTVGGGAERQRWYTLQGAVATGQPNASLTIYQNAGGNFNAPPATTAQAVGTATLSFATCASGQMTYTFTDGTGRAGTIPLTRLLPNVTCSVTTPHPTNADFALSGSWYAGAATSGQGIAAEFAPNASALFLSWFTYMPNGVNAGAAGQRWYTAQGAFTPGLRTIPVQIYETTGGVFDTSTPPGQGTVQVGTGTMAFQSCSAATFAYNFTGGSSIGQSGTINLGRVGPVPPGCAQ